MGNRLTSRIDFLCDIGYVLAKSCLCRLPDGGAAIMSGISPKGRDGVEWAATIWRPKAEHLLDPHKTYQIIAYPAQEALAKRLQESNPMRFAYHVTSW